MRVLVAMSGGVDSSVAAALVAEAGHEVVGVTLKLWGGEGDRGCCSVSDVDDARRAASHLGLDHLTFNLGEHFDDHVVNPYVQALREGRTPNPCIECNRHVKFDRLYRRAEQLGFDAVATGHHARVVERAGRRRVGRGVDASKDQSYVVHMLDAAVLARTLFPVGELTKADVRARAFALGLRTAGKPDSQEVCFIPSRGGRRSFVGSRLQLHPGQVVDETGARVGTVDAVELVTVGQRRGLGLAGGDDRRFVTDVDVAARTVTLGPGASLQRSSVTLTDVHWSGDPGGGRVLGQWSAHGRSQRARIELSSGQRAVVHWDEPQRKVAPGQTVVLYDDSDRYVIGGGVVA